MNRWKICSALLVLAIAVLCVPSANAQSIPVVAVGSSAIFPSAAIAATVGDPVRALSTPLCGTRFWTGSASAVDARATLTTPNIPNEGGTLWVAWDADVSPTVICAYLSVDSIVGQRLFFGQGSGSAGNATLLVPTAACTTAGANKIAFVWDTATTGLPVAVWNALTGGNSTMANCTGSTTSNPVHFNVAFTDVRPEDAQFVGNQRVLCTDSNSSATFPPDDKSCLGFNTGTGVNPGTAVLSSMSGSSAQAIFYSFSGTDPISGVAIPAATTFTVGAEAVIPFVNTIDTSTEGLGTLTSSGALTSVSSHTLSTVFAGQSVLTRDLVGGSGHGSNTLHALIREPMSGTFTTFEWQVVRQRDGANFQSQESGICGPTQTGCYTATCFTQAGSTIPNTACSNPVNVCIGATCGLRMRVIGTGQMVSTMNNATWTVGNPPVAGQTPSFIGYAFWSLGTFGGKANIKYLQLDGVDALFPSYSAHNGAFPGVPTGQGTQPNAITVNAGQCGGYFNGNGGTIQNFTCNGYGLPTFDGVTSGNYRAWNLLRGSYSGAVQTPNFSPLNIAGFVLGTQDQTAPILPAGTRIPDLSPTAYSSCNGPGGIGGTCSGVVTPINVFRSHYAPSVWNIGAPDNGVVSGTEHGGDVAGAIFNTQTEKDFGSIFSNSFLTWVQ